MATISLTKGYVHPWQRVLHRFVAKLPMLHMFLKLQQTMKCHEYETVS